MKELCDDMLVFSDGIFLLDQYLKKCHSGCRDREVMIEFDYQQC